MYRIVMLALLVARHAWAQAPGKWPPDSLINTRVIAHQTSPVQVWGMMRNIAAGLGVECQFCHEGAPRAPLEAIDFASDAKRTKLVAREMMRMTQDINRRLDSLPGRATGGLQVTCATCHRGVNRPVPLATLVSEIAVAAGSDSARRAYRDLRRRYFGRDSYDFGEPTLNSAAFRTARAGRITDGLALLALNDSLFPTASASWVTRGNIELMRADTTAAASAFREAIRRDPANSEAKGRLRDIGKA